MSRREREVADWRRRAGIAPELATPDPAEPIQYPTGYCFEPPSDDDIARITREAEMARALMEA